MLVKFSSFVFVNKPDLFYSSLSPHLYVTHKSCPTLSSWPNTVGTCQHHSLVFVFISLFLFSSWLLVFDIWDEIQTDYDFCFPWHSCLWFIIYTWKRFTDLTDNPSQHKINTHISHLCKSDALERDKEFTCKHFWRLALSHEFKLMTEKAESAKTLSAKEPPRAPEGGAYLTCCTVRRTGDWPWPAPPALL